MKLVKRPGALIIDLDGVLRLHDPAWTREVEERYALAPGTLHATAFAPQRLHPAFTGRISHEEWMAGVAEAVGSLEAVATWDTYRGDVDPEVRSLIADVRAAGIPVALGTNATDRLDEDLAKLGLAGAFDAVINASVIGAAKPHPAFFAAACSALRVPAAECLLVDDSARYVAGARSAGLLAFRYSSPADVAYLRRVFARSGLGR